MEGPEDQSVKRRASRAVKEALGIEGNKDVWENRRKRMARRHYGGLKEEESPPQDTTDGASNPETKEFFAKTLWSEMRMSRIAPLRFRTSDPSKGNDIPHSRTEYSFISPFTNIFGVFPYPSNPMLVPKTRFEKQKSEEHPGDESDGARSSERPLQEPVGRYELYDLSTRDGASEPETSRRRTLKIRRDIDEIEDFRPFFTYWVCFVQFMVCVVSLCVYGVGNFDIILHERKGLVLMESLSLEHVSVFEVGNIWLGPRTAHLIRLGSTFSPCMRKDDGIEEEIRNTKIFERNHTGCCIRNDYSGCVQTSSEACSSILSTFHSWKGGSGPDGRTSGPVCGQDPSYCETPSSTGFHVWADDISKWPVCFATSKRVGMPAHMTCEIIGRPCCVGIHGKCELRTEEYCRWVQGTFHPEATLCSQISCLQDVCGLGPFALDDNPDQLYRVLSALLIHAGVFHLVVSMTLQMYFMRNLEKMCGPFRIAIIYIGSGIVGNLATATLVPYRTASGPSPSQFGLLSTHFVEIIQAWNDLSKPGITLLKYSGMTVALFILGFAPWIGNYGHIFGFIAGFFLSLAFMPYSTYKEHNTRRIISVVFGFIAYIFLLVAFIIMFYITPFFECEFCKYLSCIPITPDFCRVQNINLKRDKLSIL